NLHRNDLDGTAGGFDLSPSAGREFVCPNGESMIKFSVAQYFDQATTFSGCDQTRRDQSFGVYQRVSLEQAQINDVDKSIVIAETGTTITKTTNEREMFGQAGLTTIKCAVDFATSTSLLPFGTTARCLAPTGTMSTSETFFGFVRTGGWL